MRALANYRSKPIPFRDQCGRRFCFSISVLLGVSKFFWCAKFCPIPLFPWTALLLGPPNISRFFPLSRPKCRFFISLWGLLVELRPRFKAIPPSCVFFWAHFGRLEKREILGTPRSGPPPTGPPTLPTPPFGPSPNQFFPVEGGLAWP